MRKKTAPPGLGAETVTEVLSERAQIVKRYVEMPAHVVVEIECTGKRMGSTATVVSHMKPPYSAGELIVDMLMWIDGGFVPHINAAGQYLAIFWFDLEENEIGQTEVLSYRPLVAGVAA